MSNILTYEALTLIEVLKETDADPLSVATDDYYDVVKDILSNLGDYIYITEVPTDDDDVRKMSLNRMAFTLINYFRGCNSTYNARIKLYSNPELGKATSTTKFNDTPQNGGDWDNDNHTSTITKVTNEVEMSTAEKLRFVNQLHTDYVNDFRHKFEIYEVE